MRFPKSKNLEFTRENLEIELLKSGIKYECMRGTLGGFRRGGYQKHMEKEAYKSGIKQLLQITKGSNITIMCVEPNYKYCHRRFTIRTFLDMGDKIFPVEKCTQNESKIDAYFS